MGRELSTVDRTLEVEVEAKYSGQEKSNGRRGKALYGVTRRRSSSQGGKIPFEHAPRVKA